MNISIEGLDKIEAKLNGLNKIDFTDALWKAAFTVERDAKQNCPVDTGQLRASIYSRVKKNEASVATNVEYAPFVEFGTGLFSSKGDGRTDVPWVYQDEKGQWHSTEGQQPQPFLIPALDDNKDKIVGYIKEAIKKEVSSVHIHETTDLDII